MGPLFEILCSTWSLLVVVALLLLGCGLDCYLLLLGAWFSTMQLVSMFGTLMLLLGFLWLLLLGLGSSLMHDAACWLLLLLLGLLASTAACFWLFAAANSCGLMLFFVDAVCRLLADAAPADMS